MKEPGLPARRFRANRETPRGMLLRHPASRYGLPTTKTTLFVALGHRENPCGLSII
jgi:hypothetical protein